MNRSESMKKKWKDPTYRVTQVLAMKRAWDEERRRAARSRMIGNILTQETVQKISTSNIETWQRNHA